MESNGNDQEYKRVGVVLFDFDNVIGARNGRTKYSIIYRVARIVRIIFQK